MKKIFLSCLFFIGSILATTGVSFNRAFAQQATACSTFSTSPSPVTINENSVTFTMGPTDPNATYEIEVDINKDPVPSPVTCWENIRSPQIRGTGKAISYQFTRQNERCFDKLVALEPDAFNLIHLRQIDRPPQCTNGYRVVSTCRLSFSPGSIDTSTSVFIAGSGVPAAIGTIGIRIGGLPNVVQAIVTNGSFLKNIGTFPTAREYQIDLVRITGIDQYEKISACPILTLTAGQPGQPVQNQPPSAWAPLTPQNFVTNCPGGRQGINTAIGCIPIENPNFFVEWFLRWAIGIAGGIAFLLIIFSGFQIMTSSNNPQQLQTGRELLTGAVSGLILIVFSVFLLKLIGVDILGIPGLGGP